MVPCRATNPATSNNNTRFSDRSIRYGCQYTVTVPWLPPAKRALANRLQVTHDALDTATLTITKSISDNQDADLATAITQLRLQEVAVQAASETFTKIFDSSLINYLR